MSSQIRRGDWVRRGEKAASLDRLEAYFVGTGYTPHRHDTYAIGHTLSGVHNFRYRGSLRNSLPGGTIAIYPDELHDGEAGTDEGFRYRIMYVEPALLQEVLGGRPLPYIPGGLSQDPRLMAASSALLQNLDQPLDYLEEADCIFDLAQALAAAAGNPMKRKKLNIAAAQRAREFMHDSLNAAITMDELEAVTGRDRWGLARDFRSLFGTSPYRYLTMRRLDKARELMQCGSSLAEVAVTVGFSDQSHFTNHFTRAYGITPARWLRMLR
ncbi:AraC family transcriptional regulator [Marinobacter sp. HL-58]|uniref:AraC family transcriptional regulator n=1 Tax=Marinobacter sp. HL-58 TaxID=1479237 RepID=UPI0004851B9D|nr:AraC family transcriptional regulator [Marinobacter sp. HL-58]KPP98751.1 MAG: AraC family transcriptional regulator [Marinobacter sp. HL-58]